MTRFALTVTVLVETEDDADNPVEMLDTVLSGHEKLKGNYAIDAKASIIPEGEWTVADQFNAQRAGWGMVTDIDGNEFVGSDNSECTDLTAQRYVVRIALVDGDPVAVRAIKYMKQFHPANFRAMIQRVLHQGDTK